jgi:hypothetical protein
MDVASSEAVKELLAAAALKRRPRDVGPAGPAACVDDGEDGVGEVAGDDGPTAPAAKRVRPT